uniref:Uncharacterized protein n=1 Tax=Tetranychus urticae TaxID=32264 RepID=T1JYM5_TETUR
MKLIYLLCISLITFSYVQAHPYNARSIDEFYDSLSTSRSLSSRSNSSHNKETAKIPPDHATRSTLFDNLGALVFMAVGLLSRLK